MNSKLTYLSLAISSALLVACGGGGGSTGSNVTIPITTPLPTPVIPAVSAAAPISNNGGANFEFALVNGFNGDNENIATANAAIASAGSFTNVANISIGKNEIGQVNLKEPDSDYFVMVAGRDALLRIAVTANQPNVVAPKLKVTISKVADGVVVYEQVLNNNTNGVLSQVADQPVVLLKGELGKDGFSDPIEYPISSKAVKTTMNMPDMNRSYILKIPASILTNQTLKVDVALVDVVDAIATDNAKSFTITPKVVDPLTVVKVPMTVNGKAASLPTDDYLRRALMAVIPVPNVIVKTRQVLTASIGNGISAPSEIGLPIKPALLKTLKDAQAIDLSSKLALDTEYYLGFVSAKVGGATSPGIFAAIVQDSLESKYYEKESKITWVQEVLNSWGNVKDSGGCGASLSDFNYPYANAGLNGVWNIDMFTNEGKIVLLNPRAFTSATSYCPNSLYMADYQVKRMVRDYWPAPSEVLWQRGVTMNNQELLSLGISEYTKKYPNGLQDMPSIKFVAEREKNQKLAVPKQGW